MDAEEYPARLRLDEAILLLGFAMFPAFDVLTMPPLGLDAAGFFMFPAFEVLTMPPLGLDAAGFGMFPAFDVLIILPLLGITTSF